MTDDLRRWLERLGLAQYAEAFEENDLDLDLASELSDADLRDLGVSSMGHRKKLLRAIAALGPVSEGGHQERDSAPDAEPMQVEAGFTLMSNQELREVALGLMMREVYDRAQHRC